MIGAGSAFRGAANVVFEQRPDGRLAPSTFVPTGVRTLREEIVPGVDARVLAR